MFCRAVGSGDSLLLLLGNSDESKGRFPVPRLLFLDTRFVFGVRVDVFFQDKAKMERCDSPLLCLFSLDLFLRLHRCYEECD